MANPSGAILEAPTEGFAFLPPGAGLYGQPSYYVNRPAVATKPTTVFVVPDYFARVPRYYPYDLSPWPAGRWPGYWGGIHGAGPRHWGGGGHHKPAGLAKKPKRPWEHLSYGPSPFQQKSPPPGPRDQQGGNEGYGNRKWPTSWDPITEEGHGTTVFTDKPAGGAALQADHQQLPLPGRPARRP